MEEQDSELSVDKNISSSLKFGIDRILSSGYHQDKSIGPDITVQYKNQYCSTTPVSTQCVCTGNCTRCINYRCFTSGSHLCLSPVTSNYMNLLDNYQNLHRPAPVRPLPRCEY